MMATMAGEGGLRRSRPVGPPHRSPTAPLPRPRVGGPSPHRTTQRAGTRPTPDLELLDLRLPAQPRYARLARHLLQAALRSRGGPLLRVVEQAPLLVSELVGNVVRHTGSPWFTLHVRCVGNRLRIEALDCSRALPTLLPENPMAERGRGLLLVDHYAARWGVDLLPHGKRTWCELAL